MENTTSMDIKSSRLFPSQFQFLALIFLIVGVVAVMYSIIASILFLLIAGVIITSYQGVEFKKANKRYREYSSIGFLRFGKWKALDSVEKIFVSSANVSQKMYSHANNSSTFTRTEYDAYLKFSNGSKIYLRSEKRKDKLLKKMVRLSDFFGVTVIDNAVESG